MISRSAENTVGCRLRCSSVKTSSDSATVTCACRSSPVTSPVRASAAAITGSRTAPRWLSARAVMVRPRAVMSTGGST